jgi:hypothetical protein
MARLRRKHILKEPECEPLVRIGVTQRPTTVVSHAKREDPGSFGD